MPISMTERRMRSGCALERIDAGIYTMEEGDTCE